MKNVFAFSLLASLAIAAPLKKRGVVTVTTTEEVVVTVDTTTTVWIDEVPSTVAAQATSTSAGEFYESPSSKATSSAYIAPSSSAVVAPSSSSVYVAPSSASVAPVSSAPVSSAPAYTAPAAPSTTAVPTPVSATPAYTSSAPQPSAASSSSKYTGDITYYNPAGGYGACGWNIADTDMSVALAAGQMGAESNGNEWCGKKITISYQGRTTTAKIGDKCPGCAGGGLDLTPAVWDAVAGTTDGRGFGMEWWVSE